MYVKGYINNSNLEYHVNSIVKNMDLHETEMNIEPNQKHAPVPSVYKNNNHHQVALCPFGSEYEKDELYAVNGKPVLQKTTRDEIMKYFTVNMSTIKHIRHRKSQLVDELLGVAKSEKKKLKMHAEKMHHLINEKTVQIEEQLSDWESSLTDVRTKLILKDEEDEALYEQMQLAKDGGLDQVMISISSQLQKNVSTFCEVGLPVCPYLTFKAEEFARMGGLYAHGLSTSDTMSTFPLLWSVKNNNDAVDAVFTPAGNVAVSYYAGDRVVLYGNSGEVIADTDVTGVKLGFPWGVTYHQEWSALVVVDTDSRDLVLLHPEDLTLVRRIAIPGCGEPSGVAVLGDGRLVTASKHPARITVYGEHEGELTPQSDWSTHRAAEHIEVNEMNQIIATNDNTIMKFGSSGSLLSTSQVENYEDLGHCIDSGLGLLVIADRNVILRCGGYDSQQDGLKTQPLITWERWKNSKFGDMQVYGEMQSVSMQGRKLVITGTKGLCCYFMNIAY